MGFKLNKWDKRFLEIVHIMTSWSKDPSTKCAALLVRPNRSIVSFGVNNFPQGIEDKPERLNDRPLKYELVVHSETNALLHARENVAFCTMYCSTVPCCRCAMSMIQVGITRVICIAPSEDYISRWGDSIKKTIDLFVEAGVIIGWEGK